MNCNQLHFNSITVDGFAREYAYYLPDMLCNSTALHQFTSRFGDNTSNQAVTEQIRIPIMLNLPDYTRAPEQFLATNNVLDYIDEYGYIVLSPRGGVNHARVPSWNAQSCCGENRDNNIDDVKFVREVLYEFTGNIHTTFPFVDVAIENLTLFIFGKSNGGFFTDKIGWVYAKTNPEEIAFGNRNSSGFPIRVTAVSAACGYIDDNNMSDTMNGHNKLSVLYQKGAKDVIASGCGCEDVHCGIGISEHSPMCLRSQQAYWRWMDWNGHSQSVDSVDDFGGGKVRECTVSNSTNGYVTKICAWTGAGHFLHRDNHVEPNVYRNETFAFFRDALCNQPGRMRNKLYYCNVSLPLQLRIEEMNDEIIVQQKSHKQTTSVFVKFVLVGIVVVIAIQMHRRNIGQRTQNYEQVEVFDPDV